MTFFEESIENVVVHGIIFGMSVADDDSKTFLKNISVGHLNFFTLTSIDLRYTCKKLRCACMLIYLCELHEYEVIQSLFDIGTHHSLNTATLACRWINLATLAFFFCSEGDDWKCRTGKCGTNMQGWKMRDNWVWCRIFQSHIFLSRIFSVPSEVAKLFMNAPRRLGVRQFTGDNDKRYRVVRLLRWTTLTRRRYDCVSASTTTISRGRAVMKMSYSVCLTTIPADSVCSDVLKIVFWLYLHDLLSD